MFRCLFIKLLCDITTCMQMTTEIPLLRNGPPILISFVSTLIRQTYVSLSVSSARSAHVQCLRSVSNTRGLRTMATGEQGTGERPPGKRFTVVVRETGTNGENIDKFWLTIHTQSCLISQQQLACGHFEFVCSEFGYPMFKCVTCEQLKLCPHEV